MVSAGPVADNILRAQNFAQIDSAESVVDVLRSALIPVIGPFFVGVLFGIADGLRPSGVAYAVVTANSCHSPGTPLS